MRHCFRVLVMIVLGVLAPAAGVAQDSAKSKLAENAALQYWLAFSQLPALDKDAENLTTQWKSAKMDDPAVARLLGDSRTTLMFLGRATKLSRCDWGLDYNDGVSLLMPHLSRSRDAARLAALDARRAFERHDWQAGWNDALAIIALGRNVSSDPIMIGLVVGSNLESMAIDAVAPYVLDARVSYAQAAADLDRMPKVPPFTQTLATEKRYMAHWIIAKLREEEARQPGAWKDFWKSLFTGTEQEQSPPEAASAAEAIQMVEGVLPLYDELARFLAMPQAQFDAEYPAFKKKTKAEHKLASLLLPAIDKVREKQQSTEVRRAMLLTAIAVAESGADVVRQSKDPVTGEVFQLRRLDRGFELKSSLQFDSQPVTLTFGNRQ
jgi:hypothetical protein